MKPLFLIGLLFSMTAAFAGPLPPDSPWLTSNLYLQAVKAGDRLVAVGDRGAIIYSDDQGQHWQKASTPSQVLLTDVCFSDEKHGFATGHDATVMVTTDAGLNWTVQYSDPLNGTPVGLEEDDASMDMAAYDEDMDAIPVDTSGAPLLGVWCDPSDSGHVIAVGGFGYFLETHDAGAHWHKEMKKLDNQDGWNLYAIANVPNDDGTVFAVGEKGILFLSTDHGASWKKLKSPDDGTFFGVTATGPGNVLVYGLQGSVWLTHDYGQSWQKVNSHTRSGINNGAVGADGSLLLVGNDGVLLQSYDRGASFSERVIGQRATLSSVLPLGDNKLVVTGADGIHLLNQK
jgi:photosystem II stability/assembly factor-like uncharacterized protein